MKLHLPEILRHLDSKPMGLFFAGGQVVLSHPKDKQREQKFRPLIGKLHRAEKFIFDSGMDQDPETTTAVRETAVAMMELGLFHLPAPLIWIEDPFDSDKDPEGKNRFYYLCEEAPEGISVVAMQTTDPAFPELEGLLPAVAHKLPTYTVFGSIMFIDLRTPSDGFTMLGATVCPPEIKHLAGAVVYSVKKFIVTLAAQQTVRERVEPPRVRGSNSGPRRGYAHTVVRVPTYIPEPGAGEARGPQGKRRMSLVSGYVWGKNTRPLDEQRWIAPFWRGDASLGLVAPKTRIVSAAAKGAR